MKLGEFIIKPRLTKLRQKRYNTNAIIGDDRCSARVNIPV